MKSDWSGLFPTVAADGGFSTTAPERVDGGIRNFGGHLLATAAWTAIMSAPGKYPHSLHGYFMRATVPGRRLEGKVSAMRDGRRFAQRQVQMSQDGRAVFSSITSLQAREAAEPPSAELNAPSVPRPDRCVNGPLPFSTVAIDQWIEARGVSRWPLRFWVRPRRGLPEMPAAHYAALASISDIGAARAAYVGNLHADVQLDGEAEVVPISLEHSIWFHREAKLDGWILISVSTYPSIDNRALALGQAWTEGGQLCATYVQDVLGSG